MACRCITDLSIEEKEFCLRRYLNDTKHIKASTQILVIYSKLKFETKICLNTVKFKIGTGINKICLCRLSNKYNQNLKLAANYLCRLEKFPLNQIGVEAFILKPFSHYSDCPNNRIPTLTQLCYFNLFVQGYSGRKLKKLADNGIIPRVLYEQREIVRYHMGYFTFSEWFAICGIAGNSRLPSCKEPEQHLGLNPLDFL